MGNFRTKQRKSLAAQEARLALWLLLPTFAIVFAIVLFPVLANFWISFKPVTLADLRTPTALVNKRVSKAPTEPGDEFLLSYQIRNSSRTVPLQDVHLADQLPIGLELVKSPDSCVAEAGTVACEVGLFEAGGRQVLEFTFIAGQAYFDAGAEPLAGKPEMRSRAPNVLTNLTFTGQNFVRYFKSRDFWPSLRITLSYTIFGTLGSIILGLFAAQLLNVDFRGQGVLRGLFLFPYVAPIIAVAFTWAFLLDPLSGAVNALGLHFGFWREPVAFLSQQYLPVELAGVTVKLPLALVTVITFEAWRYFPFAFLFILARLQAVPAEIYEAARVDGASSTQQFFRITLPQLTGVLATLFLLRFIWTFNKFDDIFLLTGGAAGTKTLTISVFDEAFGRQDLGAGAAVAVVLFFILGLFMVLYFRFVPEGQE